MNEDWMTAREYAETWLRNRDPGYLARVGKRAGKLLRSTGQEPGVRTGEKMNQHHRPNAADDQYRVGTYPPEILQQAFEQVRPK